MSSDKYAIVDLSDYPMLSKYTWSVSKGRNTYYAITWKGNKFVRMHSLLMNPKERRVVDHINGDGLDNRRKNLRVCTYSENAMNSKVKSSNKSGFKGVYWSNQMGKWAAQITVMYKTKHLGYFSKIKEAINKRKEAELDFFGEYAKT